LGTSQSERPQDTVGEAALQVLLKQDTEREAA
jgi:hypothetical protein